MFWEKKGDASVNSPLLYRKDLDFLKELLSFTQKKWPQEVFVPLLSVSPFGTS